MRPASFTDARLSRRYSGPTDPSFRTDTLKRLVPSPSEFSELAYSGFSTLRLHCLATPAEAAARALEVLAARPPRSKELRVVALVLGLDRDSVKAKGASLLEAIDAAFEDSFKEMEAKKREGKLDRGHLSPPTRCRLGDTRRCSREGQEAPCVRFLVAQNADCLAARHPYRLAQRWKMAGQSSWWPSVSAARPAAALPPMLVPE